MDINNLPQPKTLFVEATVNIYYTAKNDQPFRDFLKEGATHFCHQVISSNQQKISYKTLFESDLNINSEVEKLKERLQKTDKNKQFGLTIYNVEIIPNEATLQSYSECSLAVARKIYAFEQGDNDE